jgi:hypothetical protein
MGTPKKSEKRSIVNSLSRIVKYVGNWTINNDLDTPQVISSLEGMTDEQILDMVKGCRKTFRRVKRQVKRVQRVQERVERRDS